MNSINEIIAYLQSNAAKTGIMLNPGADAELIKQFEGIYNIKLPDDIRQFYEFSNGFESVDNHIFNLVTLENMIYDKEKYNEPHIWIAEYLIYSDTWELLIDPQDHNKYQIINSNHGDEGITLTHSIAKFLKHFIEGGLFEKNGLYDWYNELFVGVITQSPEKLVAKFHFEDAFNITGRGLVMSGQIIEGKLSKGDIFWFVEDGLKTIIDIKSIEFGHTGKNGFVGLMLSEYIQEETRQKIKALTGSTINIYTFK
jgi:hypothetical protein